MPTFKFTSPDGRTYRVKGPEGATQADAWGILQQQLGQAEPTTAVEPIAPPAPEAPSGPRGIGEIIQAPEPERGFAETLGGLAPLAQQTREAGFKALPFVGGAAGTAIRAGLTLPAIAAQAAGGGIGAGAGELARQALTGEDIQLGEAAREAGGFAAGAGVGGLGLKLGARGLQALRRARLGGGVDPEAQAVAETARSIGAPLSAAQLSQKAARQELAALKSSPITGVPAARGAARGVKEASEREALRLMGGARQADDVATETSTLIAKRLEQTDEAFNFVRAAVGKGNVEAGRVAPVPIGNAREALQTAAEKLKDLGVSKGVAGQIKRIAKRNPESLPFDEVLQLTSDIGKHKGAGKAIMNELQGSLRGSLKSFGDDIGVDVVGLREQAVESFKQFNLIPGIRNLSEFKSAPGYVETLARNNKALNALEKVQPGLKRDVLDTHLAQVFEKSTKQIGAMQVGVYDGDKLLKWAAANDDWLKANYGADKTKAIKNFAEFMKRAEGQIAEISRSAAPSELLAIPKSKWELVKFGINTIRAPIVIKKLTDPNSALFKAFEKGAGDAAVKEWTRIAAQAASGEAISENVDILGLPRRTRPAPPRLGRAVMGR